MKTHRDLRRVERLKRSTEGRGLRPSKKRGPIHELLEPRLLLSALPAAIVPAVTIETASAQLTLVSTGGTAQSPIYNYDISLTDTGNTDVGSFWFAWVPGLDFLPSVPTAVHAPNGWSATITGVHSAFDGSAIEFIAGAGSALTGGQQLDGFTFSTPDSPTTLAGFSPFSQTTHVESSFIYVGAPLTDPGFQFVVSNTPTSTTSASTTTLQVSASSSSFGDSVTFTATVAPATSGTTPTGTVHFLDNGATIGSGTLQDDGTATFTTNALSVGNHFITASYTGDSTYSTSGSAGITESVSGAPHLVITQQPTGGVAGANLNPVLTVAIESSTGQIDAANDSDVTIAITSGPAGGTISGATTVTAVNGVASFSGLGLDTAGTYTLTATSGALGQVSSKSFIITPDASSAHLVLEQQPTDTLVGKAMGSTIVEVKDQFGNLLTGDHSSVTIGIASTTTSTITGTTTVSTNHGIATFKNLTIRQAGAYTLQVTDATLANPTPASFSQNITPGTTTLAAPHPAASYTFGQAINLSDSLKSGAPSFVGFTGVVTLMDQNNDTLGTATVSANGMMKFSLTGIAPGDYTCTLDYAGDANHTAVTSGQFALHVHQAPTTVTLVASAARLSSSDTLTLTATVKSTKAPLVARTGNVTLMDGDTVITTMALDGNSTAVLTIPTPTAGKHAYKVVYAGDVNFVTSTSNVKSVLVT